MVAGLEMSLMPEKMKQEIHEYWLPENVEKRKKKTTWIRILDPKATIKLIDGKFTLEGKHEIIEE
jgi:hypothetical protein